MQVSKGEKHPVVLLRYYINEPQQRPDCHDNTKFAVMVHITWW